MASIPGLVQDLNAPPITPIHFDAADAAQLREMRALSYREYPSFDSVVANDGEDTYFVYLRDELPMAVREAIAAFR